jgi:hypothetical protein
MTRVDARHIATRNQRRLDRRTPTFPFHDPSFDTRLPTGDLHLIEDLPAHRIVSTQAVGLAVPFLRRRFGHRCLATIILAGRVASQKNATGLLHVGCYREGAGLSTAPPPAPLRPEASGAVGNPDFWNEPGAFDSVIQLRQAMWNLCFRVRRRQDGEPCSSATA